MSKQATDNMLSRAGGRFYDYLKDDNTSFMPGMIGAGLGAAGMAMATEGKRNESPVDRAMRTIKNALIGGALGGVGGQVGFGYGGGEALQAAVGSYKNYGKPAEPFKDPRSITQQLLQPTWLKGLTAGALGTQSWLAGKYGRTAEELKQYFGKDGLKGMVLLDDKGTAVLDKKGLPATWKGTATSPGQSRKWFIPGHRPDDYSKMIKEQLKNLRAPTMSAPGGAAVDTLESVVKHLQAQNATLRNNPQALRAFLDRHGVGKAPGNWMQRRVQDLNYALNPGAFRMNTKLRNGGSVARNLGMAAAGYMLPNLFGAGLGATGYGGEAVGRALMPAGVNLGAREQQ